MTRKKDLLSEIEKGKKLKSASERSTLKDSKDKKSGDLLSAIKQGAKLKSASERKLAEKKLSDDELAKLQIAEQLRKIQSANYGDEDELDSDEESLESSDSSTSFDSDEESYAKGKVKPNLSSKRDLPRARDSSATSSPSATGIDFSVMKSSSLLSQSSYKRKDDVPDEDGDWDMLAKEEDEKESKMRAEKEAERHRKESEKHAQMIKEKEERQQRMQAAKKDLAAALSKQKDEAKQETKRAVTSQDIESDLGTEHKGRLESAKSALEAALPKTRRPSESKETKSEAEMMSSADTLAINERRPSIDDSEPTETHAEIILPKATPASQARAVTSEDIQRDLGDSHKERMHSAKSALESALHKTRRHSEEDKSKKEKEQEELDKFKATRQSVINQAARKAEQAATLAAKLAKQKEHSAQIKTNAMTAIRGISDLGVRTKQVHSATEDAVKIAQSIATVIKSKDHTEKDLRKLETDTQAYIQKLELNLAELRAFIASAPKVQDKKWNDAIKTSTEVLKTADIAIVLAKAEVKLINAAIARDLAVASAKNAVALAQRKADVAKIAHEAAAAARKKIENKELTTQAQEQAKRAAEAQEAARLAAEAEAKRALEEAKVREAEAARLAEAQRAAEQAAAAAQQSIVRSLYGR